MSTVAGNNDTNDEQAKTQQHAQPVVSLLEKYSSLHRGIDEARKSYSKRQLEIESIEAEIRQLVDVDRIANRQAIEINLSEKEDLLQRLETLTMTDLVEAQEAEFLAKSKHESTRFREQEMRRIGEEDYNQFLNSAKAFREKITALCIRGELFGLKTSLALLSVHQLLNGPIPSQSGKISNQESENDGPTDDWCSINTTTLWEDEKTESENDEEIREFLKQLHNQNEANENKQKVLEEKKQHYSSLLEANGKREKQKKNLQSQLERLQKDARDVESRIEKLTEQTREAVDMTNRYKNESETRVETSNSSNVQKRSVSNQPPSRAGGSKTMTSNRDQSKRKSVTPYNPYARANRRKHNTLENSQKTNAPNARMISPVPTTTTRKQPQESDMGDFDSGALHGEDYPSTSTKTAVRYKRSRSSRRFGESSFRTPRECLKSDQLSSAPEANSTGLLKGDEKSQLSMLLDLEDTDDDDDEWLNAPSFSSFRRLSPKKKP